MIDISLGEYTKQEVLEIARQKDLSNVKRDLTKQGYQWYTNGRKGNNFRLTITAIPTAAAVSSVPIISIENFKKCCKDGFSINGNNDFVKLAILVCFLEYDVSFVDLTLEQMELRIKSSGFSISRQTISNYLETFTEHNVLFSFPGEYVYYVPLDTTRFITRKEWCKYWKAKYSNSTRYYKLLSKLGKEPKRRVKRYFGNALVPHYKPLVEYATQIVKELNKQEQR